jgi:uncharacterized membrane protein
MAEDWGGAGRVWVRRAGQALLVVFLLAVVALAGKPSPFAEALAGIGVIIAFAHGVHVYGWSGALLFLSLCLTVTFATENLSIATGFPFGHYHFEVAAALPHVGAVPVIVGLLYFAMGYFSWMIANLLLDDADGRLNRPFYVVVLWRTQDLHAATIVVVTFTMLFTAVLALLRWAAVKGWRS